MAAGGDTELARVEWAKSLAFGPPLDRSTVSELLAIAADATDARSEHAVYALGFATLEPHDRRRTLEALCAIVADADRIETVRGQAAEAIGEQFEFVRASKLRDNAIDCLRAALADSSPQVRFWSVFALGKLRAIEAYDDIAPLCDDDTGAPGWWTISREAATTLQALAANPRSAAGVRARQAPGPRIARSG